MFNIHEMTAAQQDAAFAEMASNSYCDFHAPGVDYLCLHRSPAMTVKAYFFDRGAPGQPVRPHNHRYDFYTQVLSGICIHSRFRICDATDPSPLIKTYLRRDWFSPLIADGETPGEGWRDHPFTNGRVPLRVEDRAIHMAGDSYFVGAIEIHDIEVDPSTVLLVTQFPNRFPSGVPTSTYFPIEKAGAPDISDLYHPMTLGQCFTRYSQIMELIGG